jgi:putative membrane protein
MNTRYRLPARIAAVFAILVAPMAWAMDHSPDAPPDSTAAGAPSGLSHTELPSGMAAGAGIDHDTVLQTTRDFIRRTAEDNAAEMTAAQYALSNSRSPDVAEFARRIIATRSQSNDELRDLATTLGVMMPTHPSSAQLRTLNELHAESGAQFDAAYARFTADSRTRALALFKRATVNSDIDPAVRTYAGNSLPTMQDTSQRANKLLASHASPTRTG